MFTPKLFIAVGATGAFFTLRETYQHIDDCYAHSEVRSFHHFNLSQDPAEAVSKAKAYANEYGIELYTSIEDLQTEMRKIQRETAEQAETRRIAYIKQAAVWEEDRLARIAEQHQQIAQGIYPIGRYFGKQFREAPVSYINWLASAAAEFEKDSIIAELAIAVADRCKDLLFPVPDPIKTIGKEKQRLTFSVTVVRRGEYYRESFGYQNGMGRVNIVTMVTDDGVCLVSKSTSFNAEPGEKLYLKATVKEFSEYKGQMQTVVQRVAVNRLFEILAA